MKKKQQHKNINKADTTSKPSPPLFPLIFLVISSLFVGSIFTFVIQFRNAEVTRESCQVIETQFISYDARYRKTKVRQIVIDCSNGKSYFIDSASITSRLKADVSELIEFENITLLIHPNGNRIVEFTSEDGKLMEFEDTIAKFGREANGFVFHSNSFLQSVCLTLKFFHQEHFSM